MQGGAPATVPVAEHLIWTILWQAIVGGENVTRYSVIPWWLFLFVVLFSTLIGLLFGFGPANKAVKNPALDAIKNNECIASVHLLHR